MILSLSFSLFLSLCFLWSGEEEEKAGEEEILVFLSHFLPLDLLGWLLPGRRAVPFLSLTPAGAGVVALQAH